VPLGTAYTRAVSPRLAQCALTHLARRPIDAEKAAAQHAAYEAALAEAGLIVERMEPLPDAPDSVFVEDTALILGEHAIVTRPGDPSRAAEADSTALSLESRFITHRLAEGRLDGGDVLRIGQRLYVGLSGRTDRAGIDALAAVAGPLGFEIIPVRIDATLHLKSAVTFAGADGEGRATLLFDPGSIASTHFTGVDPVAVAPGEGVAANVLRVGDTLFIASGNPATAERLARRGFDLVAIDASELQKAEAGLTCMSLVAMQSS
jgi:dimethylargininase